MFGSKPSAPAPRVTTSRIYPSLIPFFARVSFTALAISSWLIGIVSQVYVADAVQKYAVALTAATRRSTDLTLGASPRATLHLVRAAKARAAMASRDYVLPDDLKTLAQPVLAHRILPSVEAAMSGRAATDILDAIVSAVPVPGGAPTS